MEYCRLCSVNDKLLDVFDSRFQNGGDIVRMYIYLCSGVEILASDVISKKICQQCLDQILYMFKFRTKAGLNDRKLKKEAGVEVEKMNHVSVLIMNNLVMIKKIANSITNVQGVSDVIVIDDEDTETQNETITEPTQVNDQAQDQVAATSKTTDNEMVIDNIQSVIVENHISRPNRDLSTANTHLQTKSLTNTEIEESINVDQSKDDASTLQSDDEIGELYIDESSLVNNNTELNDEVSQTQLDNANNDGNTIKENTEIIGSSPKLDTLNTAGNTSKNNTEINESSAKLDTSDSDGNRIINNTENNASSPNQINNSISDDKKTKNEVCKSKKKDNSSSKRKNNKSVISNDVSCSKQVNISVIDDKKTTNSDESSNKIDTSFSEKAKDINASNANKSKIDDAITPKKIAICDGRNSNDSKDVSLRSGKKTKAVSKDAKRHKQNKTIESCENAIHQANNKKTESLVRKRSTSINNILKMYPNLKISADIQNLNINASVSLRRCDEKLTQQNNRKRVNSSVVVTRARKRMRRLLPAEHTFKRLEANSHINNMEEKKEMFVSSLELVSKDKIHDPASEENTKSRLHACIDCLETFKSINSLKIHKRRQLCKWCKECLKCSTFKHKHENVECKFKKKLVVHIEKLNNEVIVAPEPMECENGVDIDVEIALKEYILNKMTMTEEKIIQTETMNTAPEQPIVEGNKIRYRHLYRDIVSSYMPVNLYLSTKKKSRIVRTNKEPNTSSKEPVTEIKKTTYEKKTHQQINDILFHTSKSASSNQRRSSTNRSIASPVIKEPVPNVLNSQQQISTTFNSKSTNSPTGNQQIATPINNQQMNLPFFRPAMNQELMKPINIQQLPPENQQVTTAINKQKVNVQVTKPADTQQLTAVINKHIVSAPAMKPAENKQLSAAVNPQKRQLPGFNCAENKELSALITKNQVNVAVSKPQDNQHFTTVLNNHLNQLPAIRPKVNQPLTIPINNIQINLPTLTPAINQQITLPNMNRQSNYGSVLSQHIAIPLKHLVTKHLTIPVSTLQHANPGLNSMLSIPYTSTGTSWQHSTSGFQYDNAYTVINTNNMSSVNMNVNQHQMPTMHQFAPNILNSKMGQPNMMQMNHLNINVSKNQTASTSSRKTASTASRLTEVVDSRIPGNIQYVSAPVQATCTSGGQSFHGSVALLQKEQMNNQVLTRIEKKSMPPNEHMQTRDTSSEKGNDNPVILNGSRSLTNKIWVKNPMEINNSANI